MAVTCCNCLFAPPPTYTPGFGGGSTVFAQPAPAPASSVPNLAVESEAQQRRVSRRLTSLTAFTPMTFRRLPAVNPAWYGCVKLQASGTVALNAPNLPTLDTLFDAVCEQQPSACYPPW